MDASMDVRAKVWSPRHPWPTARMGRMPQSVVPLPQGDPESQELDFPCKRLRRGRGDRVTLVTIGCIDGQNGDIEREVRHY